jgi:hypothetical protein
MRMFWILAAAVLCGCAGAAVTSKQPPSPPPNSQVKYQSMEYKLDGTAKPSP